ncbi:MAG: DNA polymerase II large subunit [Nanoarchaeota archaeon]|nr:DNA polymerase II large subunit [Nanoarchaeota archaeon]
MVEQNKENAESIENKNIKDNTEKINQDRLAEAKPKIAESEPAKIEASQEMLDYFSMIENELNEQYTIATAARIEGLDPEKKVDIPLAKDMAERVEGLISAAAPQLIGTGVTTRIRELEKDYGALDWRVALAIALEVAQEKFCKFKDKKEAMEVGIRTGFAYHTVGIVSAPLEGFVELLIKKTRTGKEYFAPKFAGPIRGAGGTAASVCLIITDYVRVKMGYSTYDPDEKEMNRFVTELDDYHERVTNLQYHGSREEILFLAAHLPVEIEGHPTEEIEVSNYKDLPRIETNQIRGGVCLVMSMVALKAKKLWKELSKWGKSFDLEWEFMAEFLDIQKKAQSKSEDSSKSDKKDKDKAKISPNYTYLMDLVAGRPVLAHPLRNGGFRLRYGRTRCNGYSAAAIHPATMYLLNSYIATGTQLKTERPGKAAAITPCDSLEGPTVLLKDGSVFVVEDEKKARDIFPDLKKILFLGDILIAYGDFVDRAHPLVPAGYCQEWWIMELEKGIVSTFGSFDIEKAAELSELEITKINALLNEPIITKISYEDALKLSKTFNIPMHPDHDFYFKSLNKEQFMELILVMEKAKIIESSQMDRIIIPKSGKVYLEKIGLPHSLSTEHVLVEGENAKLLALILGLKNQDSLKEDLEKTRRLLDAQKQDNPKETPNENSEQTATNTNEDFDVIKTISKISGIKFRDKSGTFIGARMGRPEKAKMRKLTGSPQVLFPVGEEGGRLRCFQSAIEAGKITADFPIYRCEKCSIDSIYPICEKCLGENLRSVQCKICGVVEESKCKHEPNNFVYYQKKSIDIKKYFDSALEKLKTKSYPDLIKGVRGTSNKDHTPENLAKGILRAKHDLFVNKDGTTRYDMSELPLTYFKPNEIKTSVEKLRSLGYTKDAFGKDLKHEDQVIELKCQDLILSGNYSSPDEPAIEILFRTCNFVDDLLVNMYGLKPYYNCKNREDVIGCLVIGLAPHISAGIVGRVIGFSETQTMFAHPLYHAAMRRDTDGDEACVILLMDAFLNFSRKYLPDRIGGRTMDAPLVLTYKLIPSEVDDMVFRMDSVWKYPFEFYEASLEYKMPWDVPIELYGKRLGTKRQYENIGFTHPTSSINAGVTCSAYKTLPSMEEKLTGQMQIAENVDAVDERDVARLVIEKHFIKDIKGNLRKFSMQEYRCVGCNEKYRRPPMVGKCLKCGGKIIFTISQGSVIKYLEPSLSLAEKYNVPAYLKQSLELTKRRIEGVFGKEKEVQAGLGRWFG